MMEHDSTTEKILNWKIVDCEIRLGEYVVLERDILEKTKARETLVTFSGRQVVREVVIPYQD